MKRALIFFVFIPVVFLSACDYKNDELGKNSIVTTIFADYKNSSYCFYARTLSFSSYSNEKKETASLIYSQGSTPFTAWENLKRNFDNEAYFGHSQAIVLCEGFFEKNIKELFTFFINESALPSDIPVFFTKNGPSDFKSFSVSEAIEKRTLPHQPLYPSFFPHNRIFDIPFIEEKNGVPKCNSTVILKDFRYDFFLTDMDFYTYSLLKNKNYNRIYDDFEIPFSKTQIKKDKISILLTLNSILPTTDNSAKKHIKKNVEDFTGKLAKENRLYILSDTLTKKPQIIIKSSQKRISRLKKGGKE